MRKFVLILCLVLTACSTTGTATVTRVIDGDTIDVQISAGKTERVRIVGIDTPETVDPRKPVQCFGKEASARMKELVEGKAVTLQPKPDENADRYGRLLRYVFADGEDMGARMIAEGYAFSYKNFPHPRLDAYNELERRAREGAKGLWGGACGGKR